MQVFILSVLAATALAEQLEDALVLNDECQSTDGNDSCALNALQLRGAQKQGDESQCSPQDQWCGSSYAQKSCCGDNQCVRDGSIFKCKADGNGGCKQVGQQCGGVGMYPQQCCGNAKCQRLYGGSKMTCQKEQSSCQPQNQWCGSSYPQKTCCGSNQCVRTGSIFKCGAKASCMQVGAVCGGPGQQTQRCCGEATCERFYGGSTMKCVKKNTCVQAGGKCGGPGQQTLQCCRGQCKAPWYAPFGQKTCSS